MASVSVDITPIIQQGGLVDVEMERRSILVESRAILLCVVVDGGLRDSISHRPAPDGRPLVWQVIADIEYASWIHEGERFDPRSGQTIYVVVGPRPFLADALEEAV